MNKSHNHSLKLYNLKFASWPIYTCFNFPSNLFTPNDPWNNFTLFQFGKISIAFEIIQNEETQKFLYIDGNEFAIGLQGIQPFKPTVYAKMVNIVVYI